MANTVFVRLLESRPTLRTSFVGLLLGTARNLCATELSAKRHIRASDPEGPDPSGADPSREMEGRDAHTAVAGCINRLPESDQTLLFLRHVEGLSYAQIIYILGLRVAFSTLTRRLRSIKVTPVRVARLR